MATSSVPVIAPLVESVRARQRAYAARLFDILDVNTDDINVIHGHHRDDVLFALANQLHHAVTAAAKRRDAVTHFVYCHKTSELVEPFVVDTTVGARLAMQPAFDGSDNYLEVDLTDMKYVLHTPPCPLLWPSTARTSETQNTALQEAIAITDEVGFGELVGGHAGVVCFCPENVGDGISNWTVSLLPGTVYLTAELTRSVSDVNLCMRRAITGSTVLLHP